MIHTVIIHWIADFIVQTRWQGNNKSKNNKALLAHTVNYSLCWLVLMPWYGFWNTMIFVGVTFVCHTITDYFTSRWTAYCWGKIKEANEQIATYEPSLRYSPNNYDIEAYNIQKVIDAKRQAFSYERWFWRIIGFDQALHMIQLILTNNYVS